MRRRTAKIGKKGSKLHVTNVKIDDLIAPYLGIHDVEMVSWKNACTEESTMRCGASWNLFACWKAREAAKHWRTFWTKSDQVVE